MPALRRVGQGVLRARKAVDAVPAPGTRAKDALRRLIAGPTASQVKRGMRNFVPKTAKLEAAARDGHTVT